MQATGRADSQSPIVTPEVHSAPSLRYADGDVFNGAEATTEVPQIGKVWRVRRGYSTWHV